MRLSELSRAVGLPSATVKWYLRIGLVPKGTATAVNQAEYDQSHVRRLRLARTLVEIGGLSIEQTRQVIEVIDDPDRSMNEVIKVAHRSLSPARAVEPPAEALAAVTRFLTRRGWAVAPDSPALRDLAAVLASVHTLETGGSADRSLTPSVDSDAAIDALLRPYADAVDGLAEQEIANTPTDLPHDALAERIIVGTVLMEHALAALRRLAQEHHGERRFRTTDTSPEPDAG